MEGSPSEKIHRQDVLEVDSEELSQTRLEEIFADPDNAFLTEIPQNLERIERATSSEEALTIAQELILLRLERTFKIEPLYDLDGFETARVDFKKMYNFLESVKTNNRFVGEGGYATVVSSPTDDIVNVPTEVCYKIAKHVIAPDLSSLSKEAKMQETFASVAEEVGGHLNVPQPYFIAEIGNTKVFAMEKLPAVSLRDLEEGKGFVPDWFNVDIFCEQLRAFLDTLHQKGLYHRDLHEGNIMIRQSVELPEDGMYGYVIDFGFSDYCSETLENPYQKELNGQVFTYLEDYAIIEKVKKSLNTLKLKV
jgi:serine/threonine protein kinase